MEIRGPTHVQPPCTLPPTGTINGNFIEDLAPAGCPKTQYPCVEQIAALITDVFLGRSNVQIFPHRNNSNQCHTISFEILMRHNMQNVRKDEKLKKNWAQIAVEITKLCVLQH